MKTMKKVFSVLLLVTLVLSLSVNAFAAKGPRTYTVTIYPGNNGTVSGGGDSIAKEIASDGSIESVVVAGDNKSLTFNGATISVSNDKYYIRGVREAGKDGGVYGSNATFSVTKDTNMVIVYGMQGDAVQYTVRYLSQDGQTPMSEVAPESGVPASATGYGPADDAEHRPIVGAYPIDGYLSYALNPAGELVRTDNITMTLSSDGENVFTFYYLPVEEAAENPAAPENPATPAQQEQTDEQPADEPADEPAADDDAAADAADDAAEQELVELGDEEVPLAAPEEILDMDVPLANAPGAQSIGGSSLPASWTEGPGAIFANHAVMAGIGGGVIVIAVALWWFLASRKKDKENAK